MGLSIHLPSPRRDPVFAGALALLAAAVVWALPSFAAGGSTRAPGVRALAIGAALLAVAVQRPAEPARSRAFWRLIAVGLVFFLGTQFWQLEAGVLLPSTLTRRQDLLYLARYLFLIMAMEMRPDAPRPGRSEDQLRQLDTVGAVLFLFALIAYVILSPPFPDAASVSGVSLRGIFMVLDLFLVIRVATLSTQSRTPYWRSAYGWFAVVFTLRGINNLVSGSPGVASIALGSDPPVGPIWLALFLPLLIVARLAPDVAAEAAVQEASPAAAQTRLAPLVAYAFAFPVFHFGMERLGIVADDRAGPREMIVLAFLGVAAGLLWIYQRILMKENQRLEVERQLMAEEAAEARRMEGLGRLAGGVAHDFNNLLTVVRGRTELLLAEHPGSLMTEDLEAIRQAARRGEGVTRQLLAFGRKQILRPEVLDVGEVVREIAPLLRSAVSEEVKIAVSVKAEAPLVIADQGQVEMALLNLAVNAREAMPGGGLLAIDVERTDLDRAAAAEIPEAHEGSYVRLTVRDTGKGMDEETLQRIFDPFFTTKPFGTGAGLGLPAVHGFVRQSGGAVKVVSEPGRGATFQIFLPRVDPPVADRHDPDDPAAIPGNGR